MSMPRKIRCLVDRVTDHGDRVYTVELKPERPIPVFLPGQFLHLTVDDFDPTGFWPESRVFSIASSPGERNHLTVAYSVKGVYTAKMEKELCPGRVVWVKLPYGEFVVNGGGDAVLIAGGTGITAFQAFIEGLASDHPGKVILIYGARRPGLLLGREKIIQKGKEDATFWTFLFAEDGYAGPEKQVPEGAVRPGRIRLDVLKDCIVSDAAVYYLAGPPAMIKAVRNDLIHLGIGEGNIRVDAWE